VFVVIDGERVLIGGWDPRCMGLSPMSLSGKSTIGFDLFFAVSQALLLFADALG